MLTQGTGWGRSPSSNSNKTGFAHAFLPATFKFDSDLGFGLTDNASDLVRIAEVSDGGVTYLKLTSGLACNFAD